ESGSSDELLEPLRRKVTDRFRNGSVDCRKNVVENREFGRNGEFGSEERNMSRLDLFEFNEYDEFDGQKMRNDYMVGRDENPVNLEVGPVETIEMLEDEAHMPISSFREKREASDKPIRLQGKNGVLKVMVNKKKKMGLSHNSYDHHKFENRNISSSEDAIRKNALVRSSLFPDSKHQKSDPLTKKEKSKLKLRKSSPTKSRKGRDLATDNGDTPLKRGPPDVKACDSTKG
ncbi:unnamed protein product, partial [Ilex paraguariensis]